MRLEKLDPALQISVGGTEARHTVFVHTAGALDSGALERLEKLNAHAAAPAGKLYTAELTSIEIDELSEQDWVAYLRLSRPMKPL